MGASKYVMDSPWFTMKLLKDKAMACMVAKHFCASLASGAIPVLAIRNGPPDLSQSNFGAFWNRIMSAMGFWNPLDASKASPTGHVLISGNSAWHWVKRWQPSEATAEASKSSRCMSNSQEYHKHAMCFPQKLTNDLVSIVLLYWQVWLAGSGSHSLSKQTLKVSVHTTWCANIVRMAVLRTFQVEACFGAFGLPRYLRTK